MRKRLAAGDLDHLAHQIDAGDQLRSPDARPGCACSSRGNRRRGCVVVEIFERAGAAIVVPPCASATAEAHRRLRGSRTGATARRLLPDLLTAALQRAFALEAVDDIVRRRRAPAPRCGARARSSFLDIEPAVAEGGRAPRACACGIRRSNSSDRRAMRMPRPPPPAAALIMTGKPIALRQANAASGDVQTAARCPERVGTPAAAAFPRARDLVAHQADGLRRRARRRRARPLDRGGELGILRQETVAGMDGVGAGRPARGGEIASRSEIGFRRLAADRCRRSRPPAARQASPRRPCCRPAPCAARARVPHE